MMKFPRFLIFNIITDFYLSCLNHVLFFSSKRLSSIFIDFVYIFVNFLAIFACILLPLMLLNKANHCLEKELLINILLSVLPYSLMLFTFINKDFFRSRSIGKRMIGYKIVDINTGLEASKSQCLYRNITLAIWPIETIVMIISPSRRLGDLIAKTKLIDAEIIDKETIIDDINTTKLRGNYKGVWLKSVIIVIILDSIIYGSMLFSSPLFRASSLEILSK